MGAIWDKYLKEQRASGHPRCRLPLIIPLVFYHGRDQWEPGELGTLLGPVPAGLSGHVPNFEFVVSDFAAAGAPEFRGTVLLQALPRVFHALPGGNLRDELARIMILWRGLTDDPSGSWLFRAMLEYIYRVDDSVTVDEVSDAARIGISNSRPTYNGC